MLLTFHETNRIAVQHCRQNLLQQTTMQICKAADRHSAIVHCTLGGHSKQWPPCLTSRTTEMPEDRLYSRCNRILGIDHKHDEMLRLWHGYSADQLQLQPISVPTESTHEFH